MYNPGDTVKIDASNENLKGIGADVQLTKNKKVKIIKEFPYGWFEVESEMFGNKFIADVPHTFLKKL